MLVSFKIKNFRSIRTEQLFSLVASRFRGFEDSLGKSKHTKNGILPVAAVFGANAAGKTTLLLALESFSDAVNYSHNSWETISRLPFEPHFFSDEQETLMEAEFLIADEPYRFGFIANGTRFIREWLFQGKKRVFERERDSFKFGRISGLKSITRFTRPNALFLSTAAQNNHPVLTGLAQWISAWSAISENTTTERRFTAHLLKQEDSKRFLLKALRTLDPQIVDIEQGEIDMDKRPFTLKDPRYEALIGSAEEWNALRILRRSNDGEREAKTRIREESAGTRRYFSMIGTILVILASGSVLLVDEADSSLHPTLLRALISLFHSPKTNLKSAQLIINTHDTSLLAGGILRPDEVFFVEKQRDEGSVIYSLADFTGARSEAGVQRQYLEGRFGALPFLENHFEIFAKEMQEATEEGDDVPPETP